MPRIAHCQKDHSPAAADHSVVEVSNLIACAIANIVDVAVIASPRPAFSNVTHTTSPSEHPYSTSRGIPPLVLIAGM